MTEEELIGNFHYNGFDISNYKGKIKVINTDESNFIDGGKTAIATTGTFSCTNILIYNEDFAYLAHMFPSETVGKNNDFNKRLEEIKKIFINKEIHEANIAIILGESIDYKKNMNFHNLDYLNQKINLLTEFCNDQNISLNILPILRSKYLLFDLDNKLLFIDNKEKHPIDIKKIENLKTTVTNPKKGNSDKFL